MIFELKLNEMESDHGGYEAVTCRKRIGSRSDYTRSPEFNRQLHEKAGIEMRALSLGNGVAPLSSLGWSKWLLAEHMSGSMIHLPATTTRRGRSGCQIIFTDSRAPMAGLLTLQSIIAWIVTSSTRLRKKHQT